MGHGYTCSRKSLLGILISLAVRVTNLGVAVRVLITYVDYWMNTQLVLSLTLAGEWGDGKITHLPSTSI